MKAPVLLIGFNRPDNMCEVFAQIKKAQPEVLYIAVDGPRPDKEGEAEKCQQCQQLAKQVDWPCELYTLFREKNVGCALGVSGAISWAFEKEDRLIILEDDCVPVLSFFNFCDEMLEMYKDDTRVWQISGRSNHPDSQFFYNKSYLFSHYAHIWGWATWKRCWDYYDLKMSDFPQYLEMGGARNFMPTLSIGNKSNKFYKNCYNHINSVSSHTWDYQWSYIKLKNAALGIVPCKNLIHNIGENGAHYTGMPEDIPSEDIPLNFIHPSLVLVNREYDLYHYKHHIKKRSIFVRAINKAIRIVKKNILHFF